MADTILLTGATGFIGIRILETWIRETDSNLICLVRPGKDESPGAKIERAASTLSSRAVTQSLGERVWVLRGDLGMPRFGVGPAEWETLAGSLTHIIHCGAAVRFDLTLDEARHVNTDGTRTVLELADRCRRLRRIDYVSTAYVAGCRTSLVMEEDLADDAPHNNTYEQSKYEAEQAISLVNGRLPVCVVRPSVVVCDARDGGLPPHGAFTRLMTAYSKGQVESLPGKPTVALDLVTADYVADAMAAIAADDSTIGRRYHLCAGADNMTTLAEIVETSARCFNRERLSLISIQEFERFRSHVAENGSPTDMDLLEELDLYVAYLNTTVRFDVSKAMSVLSGSGLCAPPFNSYFDKVARAIKEKT